MTDSKIIPKDNGPLSDNERIKTESNYLRGTIAEDLQNGLTGGFTPDNIQLVKFHGLYQQDDRDIRAERTEQKLEPRHHLMFRARLPGGVVSPEQWLGIDAFAESATIYGSIRLTTRQTFQYHGILKRDLKTVFQGMDKIGIDSIFTAGDVNRNTICTSNPEQSFLHQEAYAFAKTLSEHLLPHTKAYAEVWLDKEKVLSTENQNEPIYQETFLPRKFKATVSIPPDNDIDLYANDLNFVAIEEKGALVGFNVLIGGGLGMTHGDQTTFPRPASLIGYIDKSQGLNIATAVVTTQRDFGNRSNRKLSKLKHTVEEYGLDAIKAEIEKRSGILFEAARPMHFKTRGDHFGWVTGTNGLHHLTLYIESGRILDRQPADDTAILQSPHLFKTGLKKIAETLVTLNQAQVSDQPKAEFRLTANQNIIIANVPDDQKATIEALAKQHGLWQSRLSPVRSQAMACVSLPTCPLAMAEAERFLPNFIDQLEYIMGKHHMIDAPLIARISGCPNGCSRAMLAEIGLIGKAPNRYNLHIGGNRIGSRIPRLYRENITTEAIFEILDDLIGQWARKRELGEGFGDFVVRAGIVAPVLDSAKDFYNV